MITLIAQMAGEPTLFPYLYILYQNLEPMDHLRKFRQRSTHRMAACLLTAGIVLSPGYAPATGKANTAPSPDSNCLSAQKDIILKGQANLKLSGVKVRLGKAKLVTTTDSLGNYMIRIPARYRKDVLNLTFSKKKYVADRYLLNLANKGDTIILNPQLVAHADLIMQRSPGWAPVDPYRSVERKPKIRIRHGCPRL